MRIKYFLLTLLVTLLAACQSPTVTGEMTQLSGSVTESTPADQQVGTPAAPTAGAYSEERPATVDVQAPTTAEVQDELTITILYDNQPYDPYLETAWGYAALIQTAEHNLLFDTGGDSAILQKNMHTLRIEPQDIDSVLLSHAHEDHIDGLVSLLSAGMKPQVYLLASFPESFKEEVRSLAPLTEIDSGTSLDWGIYTTGESGGRVPEQSLVVSTPRGLVVITGCAHPGIVQIIEGICATYQQPVYLVMGGFHLEGQSQADIAAIVKEFRRLGVQKVAPSHCSGGGAVLQFKEEYGDDFLMAGAGRVITINN